MKDLKLFPLSGSINSNGSGVVKDKLRFILIDDDPFDNFLSGALINHLDSNIAINSFKDPLDALKYILTDRPFSENFHTIILLDINLPRMISWEFLEKFKKQSEDFRSSFTLFILSSFIDGRDKIRVNSCPVIKGYFQKPLGKEALKRLVEKKSEHAEE